MRPMSDIFIGDVYKPMWSGLNEWCVTDKNDKEKMVQIKMIPRSNTYPEHLNKPIWKKNTDTIFNNRVLIGFEGRVHHTTADMRLANARPN